MFALAHLLAGSLPSAVDPVRSGWLARWRHYHARPSGCLQFSGNLPATLPSKPRLPSAVQAPETPVRPPVSPVVRVRSIPLPANAEPIPVASRRLTAADSAAQFVVWMRGHGIVGEVTSRSLADAYYQEWCEVAGIIPGPRREFLAAVEPLVTAKYERRTYDRSGRESGKPTYYLIGTGPPPAVAEQRSDSKPSRALGRQMSASPERDVSKPRAREVTARKLKRAA